MVKLTTANRARLVQKVLDSGLFDLNWAKLHGASADPEVAVYQYLTRQIELKGPNVIFDDDWYLTTYDDVRRSGLQPLVHYIDHGRAEKRTPGPLFSEDWYISSNPNSSVYKRGTLAHYLLEGRHEGLSPNPVFNPLWYISTYGHAYADLAHYDPFEHYLLKGSDDGRDPGPLFNTSWYLSRYPSVIRTRENPLGHFLLNDGRFGARARYAPLTPELPVEQLASWKYLARHDIVKYQIGSADGIGDRPIIIFSTHEMSRTGAPLIILNIIKYFAALNQFELIVFADRLGDLEIEFRRFAHIVDFSHHSPFDSTICAADLIFEVKSRCILSLCNTANSNHFTGALKGAGIPVITLVHEMLYVYPDAAIQDLYAFSDQIIFPAQFVREVADSRVRLPHGKGIVLPQGLLNPRFGQGNSQHARTLIRRELSIPQEAPIVLGCGTADIRKGVDLFITMAQQAKARGRTDVHFVWLGSTTANSAFFYWMERDVLASGLGDQFHFVGEKADPQSYYLAADVFAMTSREDPFPCVIHEAMACGLTIVAFADAGGAPEALAEGSGLVVPYRDTWQMAAEVCTLLDDKELRQRIGGAAKKRVGEKYSFEDYGHALVDVARFDLGIQTLPIGKLKREPAQPRVLFFARDWWISGVNSFTETLVRYLTGKGVDAAIVFPTLNSANGEFIPDLPTVKLGLSGPAVEQWQRIIDFIESQGPCIFVPNYDYTSSAVTPRLSSSVGSIGIIHSDDIEHYDHAARIGRYWNRTVCSNSYLKGELVDINAAFEKTTEVIPYGVTIPQAGEKRSERPAGSPIRIVYCGRLTQHQKRVRDISAIITQLRTMSVDFSMTIIGEGSDAGWLESELSIDIQEGRVVMAGRLSRDDCYRVFRENDAFLLVSDFEGMPISLIEAMACGCVPVVSDIASGIPDLVTPDTGIRVPVGDVHEFANVLMKLQQSPGMMHRLSLQSVKHIEQGGFTTEAMGERYLRLINEVWRDITTGNYQRPRSLTWRGPLDGVNPPPYMFDTELR